MYKEHPSFKEPSNVNEKVWRYMDFTKFLALLDSETLYFTRADKFEDPFEGSYPRINVSARQRVPSEIPENQKDMYLTAVANMPEINKQWPRYIAVNCWHLNNHESAAMWKLYLKSNEGIAIQTSFNKLRSSFVHCNEDVFLGQVKYIDYETEWIEAGNILNPFVHKRKSFEHEREIRALVTKWPVVGAEGWNFSIDTINHGLAINVDLDILIEHIYVAPDAPSWFADLVKSAVIKYGKDYEVIHSNLTQQPLY